jgi:TPP-dependent 2-oxoacid decarboxylase
VAPTTTTVGGYLAARLHEIGIGHYFAVPGDYNLVLLDELLKHSSLEMVGCCNELNAGYAADGYARATGGAAAVFVTFSVGGLSVVNAIAGAYAEDLPVIIVSGGPNTNSEAEYELLHHTIGSISTRYQSSIFAEVTAASILVRHPSEAPEQIDHALDMALRCRKPVYLEVACNIAGARTAAPRARSFGGLPTSDPDSLEGAVSHAAELFAAAVKPVLVAGVKLRSFSAEAAFARLADAAGCAVATMPNAKSFFSEEHPQYMGTYWGSVSSPGCNEIVESSDLCVYAGPTFTDYTTVGHSTLFADGKSIVAGPAAVALPGARYSDVALADFLSGLAGRLEPNDASLVAFQRIREDLAPLAPGSPDAPISTRQLVARIQRLLGTDCALIAETGDSWFNGMRLSLPEGCRFEIQMQYGSIGWSVGATLGYTLGSPKRRVIAMIGDGSFQLTAQELSTMIRMGVRPILILINNGGYTIEVEIHDGPYNAIQNWDYAALVEVFKAGGGEGMGRRVTTEGELDAALAESATASGPCLIEVAIDRDDCSKTLLEWGSHVARNNGRPPRIGGS